MNSIKMLQSIHTVHHCPWSYDCIKKYTNVCIIITIIIIITTSYNESATKISHLPTKPNRKI